ncbi:hypothetical protein AJ80_06215 [Polytolypa hystricis UAMH7299]|uniref:Tachykinin family protein n=1 Tax=Polytolypa hystricis (strain UAMH7299) TaxID=1447883 RepID=A0A2B7XXF9_POLH7|nr:hypothetical protein AJ80_06215 [Polytolypa hystricis UAMH7299]
MAGRPPQLQPDDKAKPDKTDSARTASAASHGTKRSSTALSDLPSFTFIDHDDDLTSKRISDANARKAIRSHVMRDVRRRERLAGRKRVSKRSQKGPPRISDKEHTTVQDEHPLNLPLRTTGSSPQSTSSDFTYFSSRPQSPAWTGRHDDASPLALPSPLLDLGASQSDPFLTLPGSHDSPVVIDGLMKYFSGILIPMTFPSQSRRPQSPGDRKPVLWFAAPEPGAFFGNMSLSAAHRAMMKVNNAVKVRSPRTMDMAKEEPDYYVMKAKCIEQMNELIKDPERSLDDVAFHIVISLISSALIFGDFREARIHMEGLKTMAALRGGVFSPKFSMRILSNLLVCDLKVSGGMMTRPLFPIVWKPPPIPPALAQRAFPSPSSPFSHLAESFYSNTIFSQSLAQIMKGLRDLLFLDVYDSLEPGALTVEEHELFRLHAHTIEHDLLDYPYRLPRRTPTNADVPTISPTENAARVSAIAYMSFCFVVSPPASGLSRALVSHVRRALAACPISQVDSRAEWNLDLLAWVAFVGAHGSFEPSTRAWFIERLREIVAIRGWKEWTEMELVLFRHFYLPRLQKLKWKRIWIDAISDPVLVDIID